MVGTLFPDRRRTIRSAASLTRIALVPESGASHYRREEIRRGVSRPHWTRLCRARAGLSALAWRRRNKLLRRRTGVSFLPAAVEIRKGFPVAQNLPGRPSV